MERIKVPKPGKQRLQLLTPTHFLMEGKIFIFGYNFKFLIGMTGKGKAAKVNILGHVFISQILAAHLLVFQMGCSNPPGPSVYATFSMPCFYTHVCVCVCVRVRMLVGMRVKLLTYWSK